MIMSLERKLQVYALVGDHFRKRGTRWHAGFLAELIGWAMLLFSLQPELFLFYYTFVAGNKY